MALLDIQRGFQKIGDIRTGTTALSKAGKRYPTALETFRITTPSRDMAVVIAECFGGEPAPWEGQWEVLTGQTEIRVSVPPYEGAVTQWYEMWTQAGCLRRCDSRVEQKSGGPCLCPHAKDPHDEEEVRAAALARSRMAKEFPPRACGVKTRVSVMIPYLPGLGVFRIVTGSHYASVEIGNQIELLRLARAQGVFLPATLGIQKRKKVEDGRTSTYGVPFLRVDASLRDIISGELASRGWDAQLPAGPPALPALPAADPGPVAVAAPAGSLTARQVMARGLAATGTAEVEALARIVEEAGGGPEWEQAQEFLRNRWRALRAQENAA